MTRILAHGIRLDPNTFFEQGSGRLDQRAFFSEAEIEQLVNRKVDSFSLERLDHLIVSCQ